MRVPIADYMPRRHMCHPSISRYPATHSARSMASDTLPRGRTPKVALAKGFSMMDWVKLTHTATDLSGAQRHGGERGYTMEEVKQHRSEHDAWAVFMGKVYNITPYLMYHPGGKDILIKAAGRDCTSLFNKYHPWVNLNGLVGKLVVGWLIEPEVDGTQGDREAAGPASRALVMDPPQPKVKINVQQLFEKDEPASEDGQAPLEVEDKVVDRVQSVITDV